VDEFRIYDGRLTPEEIAANYLAGPDALALPVTLLVSNSVSALTLSWPAYALGFVAESAPALGPNETWSALGGEPTLAEDRWWLTKPESDDAKFFRLKR
jgi:hypothetical protein